MDIKCRLQLAALGFQFIAQGCGAPGWVVLSFVTVNVSLLALILIDQWKPAKG